MVLRLTLLMPTKSESFCLELLTHGVKYVYEELVIWIWGHHPIPTQSVVLLSAGQSINCVRMKYTVWMVCARYTASVVLLKLVL